jgi:hypothetical protein
MGNHPQQVQTVSMVGVYRENLPVEPFGFAQAPGLMVSKGISEYHLNVQ